MTWVDTMTWVPNQARNDEAADAAQFLSRFGYVILALGVPTGAVLYELAIFVLYPVAIVSFVLSALLDPPEDMWRRARGAFTQPIVVLSLAGIAWAGVSVLWTPFSIAAGQHILKLSLWMVSVFLGLVTTRGRARATDLYLFPIGLVIGMAAIFAAFVARRYGAQVEPQRIMDSAIVLVATLFPAMGGLAARGRNGWARLLLIAGFIYVYAIGSTPLMIALLVGFAALSVIVTAELARAVMNSGLSVLDPPFSTLARAYAMVIHEKLLLVTGHGFEALTRGLQMDLFPPFTPRGALFAMWFELGVVGAWIAAAAVWFGFHRIADAPPRLAPYLAAALACNLTLAALIENFGDMLWTVSLAAAILSADVAARSQYRTTRPSAAHLALF